MGPLAETHVVGPLAETHVVGPLAETHLVGPLAETHVVGPLAKTLSRFRREILTKILCHAHLTKSVSFRKLASTLCKIFF